LESLESRLEATGSKVAEGQINQHQKGGGGKRINERSGPRGLIRATPETGEEKSEGGGPQYTKRETTRQSNRPGRNLCGHPESPNQKRSKDLGGVWHKGGVRSKRTSAWASGAVAEQTAHGVKKSKGRGDENQGQAVVGDGRKSFHRGPKEGSRQSCYIARASSARAEQGGTPLGGKDEKKTAGQNPRGPVMPHQNGLSTGKQVRAVGRSSTGGNVQEVDTFGVP